MSKKQLYIAYGSNINLKQMAFRCPHSKVVGVSEIKTLNWNSEVLQRLFQKKI